MLLFPTLIESIQLVPQFVSFPHTSRCVEDHFVVVQKSNFLPRIEIIVFYFRADGDDVMSYHKPHYAAFSPPGRLYKS